MYAWLLRRVLQIVPLVAGATLVVFLLVNAVPGNPVDAFADDPQVRPEDLARIKQSLGLDQPLHVRYLVWVGNVATGDLGRSMLTGREVRAEIFNKLPNTLLLTLSAFVLALLFAIPAGVYSAVRRNSWLDHLVSVVSVFGVSIPRFWFGLILILFFSVRLGWLPSGGVGGGEDSGLGDRLRHLAMPALTLAIAEMSGWTRYIRGQMLEVLGQEYVRTARAKGLRANVVVYRHALRNALLPLVTLLGLAIPELVGGALIVETIFSWPGMGRLAFEAATQRDYTMIMGTVLVSTVIVILGNLCADIGYRVLDPRIGR